MAKVHISWRYTLGWIPKTTENLSMSRLRTDWLGPYRENAQDLAVKLEHLLVDYLPTTQSRKRKQLCGGEGEQGNGFQMWRRLFEDNRGSGDVVEYAGIEVLREYKACTKISEVSARMEAWKKAVRHLWIRDYDMSENAQVDVLEHHPEGTQDGDCQGAQIYQCRLREVHGLVPRSMYNSPA